MASLTMDLIKDESSSEYMVRMTPPQTEDAGISVGKSAVCFVIDVSGSMNAAAQITTDDGDKVNHGWSQLDIAKHSTNTFVASLSDDDYVSVVTYSDGANVLLGWTKCDSEGRDKAIAAIHSMRPERSTNLMAGITTGYKQFDDFPEPNNELENYALSLIITTDGMPSSQWHPARGRDGYKPLAKTLHKGLSKKRGISACPEITTIGIGFQLDSELLLGFSQTFLHMPDPGQIGPFIVNLLAAVRSTARLPDASKVAANFCSLEVAPASAVVTVLGYDAKTSTEINADGVEVCIVPLGSMCYDQPRHILFSTSGPDFTVALAVGGFTGSNALATCNGAAASAPTEPQAKNFALQKLRLMVAAALDEAAANGVANEAATEAVAGPLTRVIAQMKASPVANEDAVKRLIATLEKECLLGTEASNFRKWGGHYFRTLPCMLRAERRSNFRDECLQHFGHDARNREALFEEQSNQAEMRFATLAPPEPSLLRPQAPVFAPQTAGGVSQPAMAAPPPRPVALPDEFMRGGGCFAPDATVTLVLPDGGARAVKCADVRSGDRLVVDGGVSAVVRCVVLTECAGGRALLTRLPGGVELTPWHPVREAGGRWRFPTMLGTPVVRAAPFVCNFVLAERHSAIMVGGVPCAALGHGLEEPVVAHPYWGTDAVITDLMRRPGWEAGRVVLPATAAALD